MVQTLGRTGHTLVVQVVALDLPNHGYSVFLVTVLKGRILGSLGPVEGGFDAPKPVHFDPIPM